MGLTDATQIRLLGECRQQRVCCVVVAPGFTGSTSTPEVSSAADRTAPSPIGSVVSDKLKEESGLPVALFFYLQALKPLPHPPAMRGLGLRDARAVFISFWRVVLELRNHALE